MPTDGGRRRRRRAEIDATAFDQRSKGGYTPAHSLCENGAITLEMIDAVHAISASPFRQTSNDGMTPAHLLCENTAITAQMVKARPYTRRFLYGRVHVSFLWARTCVLLWARPCVVFF